VVETVRGVDFVVLVTEPTPFAFHDLQLALQTMHTLGLPCSVVLNRAGTDGDATRSYCRDRRIPILAEIPDDLRLAKASSAGLIAVDVLPDLVPLFQQLLSNIHERVRGKALQWAS
jgi:MinD superfamily P-loop ATPase